MSALVIDVQHRRGDFQLNVRAQLDGRVTGIFGRSGAGKSTLLHLIAGLQRPERGSIRLDSDVLADHENGVHIRPHRRRIGIVFQDARLFPHRSVESNLRFGMKYRASDKNQPSFDSIVDLLDLRPMLSRRPLSLSGGEQQRVALGRALLSSPRLLLLDEPLASLDYAMRDRILPYLVRVCQQTNVPVLYVSHELGEILQMTDTLLLLEQGRAAGCGRYSDLVHEDSSLAALAGSRIENVLSMRVHKRDEAEGCTILRSDNESGGSSDPWRGPLIAAEFNSPVSVSIAADDIALAMHEVRDTSMQNQLQGTIRRASEHRGRMHIEIDIAGQFVIVQLSSGSYRRLGLEPGKHVWCLIKSNSLRLRTL